MTKYDHNFDRKRNCWTTPIYFCAQGLASWWMTTVLAFSTTRTVCVGSFVKVSLLTIVLLYSNTWTSSHFIEFEFHRACKLRVRTHIEFCEYEFFEFKLEFRDEFAEFWLEHFEYYVQVLSSSSFSKLQTIELEFHRIWNLSGKTFEIWVVEIVNTHKM